MILDYNFNRFTRNFSISYINEQGNKEVLNFPNQNKFKTFYYTPTGRYTAWNGAKCDVMYTDKPSKFDIKRFIRELPKEYADRLEGRTNPRLYTFDIENTFVKGDEPDPVGAKNPITTISVVSPEMNSIVLGTIKLTPQQIKEVEQNVSAYIDTIDYFKTLHLPKPSFRYLYFEQEHDMLEYFMKNIVAKVPILAGWNSIGYDWLYITNRIKNFFPDISVKDASCVGCTESDTYITMKNDKINYQKPVHTLVLDLMEIIEHKDMAVLPIKESMSLNYIASETIGVQKVDYEGDLMDLLNNEPARYVYYNAIDSVLVQLINYRFRVLDIIYSHSLYCRERIGKCFGMIALTESLVFNDFYENDLQIVNEDFDRENGWLVGAYVKEPMPGRWDFVTCNDFASLYPSTIITCNLSFENFIGGYYDEAELEHYRNPQYIIVCGAVYENEGTAAKPKIGKLVKYCLDEKRLKKYREDKNYFVSVNGNVYRNDKDYAFKRIQTKLKSTRNISKYLSKKMDATVVLDIEHIQEGKTEAHMHTYEDDVKKELELLGFPMESGNDIAKYDINELKRVVKIDIDYLVCKEQSIKALMNSMYGGSSRPEFYWFNLALANDITGEARTVIHLMEKHFTTFWNEEWGKMQEYHKRWNIEVDTEKIPEIISNSPANSLVSIIYGDTDSLYISYDPLLHTIKGFETLSDREKLDIILKINLDFLNEHNFDYIKEYYAKRHADSVHNFELETVNKRGCWLNVKKRYAQVLMWKDGKIFDEDEYKVKTKGLELIKASIPTLARKHLTRLMKTLIISDSDMLVQELNFMLMQCKEEFMTAHPDDISGNLSVKNYAKYVIDDHGETLVTATGAPFNVKALAYHNWLIHKNGLKEEPIYGGKMKWYITNKDKKFGNTNFAYQAKKYPRWADKLAPIDRVAMFKLFVVEPFNRVLSAIGLPELGVDGYIQLSLF